MPVRSYQELTAQQSEAWSAALARRMLEPSPFPPTEYLPVPWFGRVRQRVAAPVYWLSYRASDLADTAQAFADGVFGVARAIHYHPKPKKRADLGLTISFPKWAPLVSASQEQER